jgi:hypothetical protein
LLTTTGKQKLSYHAFALPLAQIARSGSHVTVWGQVRPGAGARVYRLQRKVGGSWRTFGSTRRTPRNGTFTVTLALPRGTQIRILAPAVGWTGAPLVLT